MKAWNLGVISMVEPAGRPSSMIMFKPRYMLEGGGTSAVPVPLSGACALATSLACVKGALKTGEVDAHHVPGLRASKGEGANASLILAELSCMPSHS